MTSPDQIADALQARGREIGRRAVDAMYEDPFWEARFGPRGRRHADEDGDFHIGYLAEALRLGTKATFEGYAVWLREVLVTRGMCTRHLTEQFARLGAAVRESGALPEAGAALVDAYLAAGSAALRYPAGSPERALQDAEPAAAERAAEALVRRYGGTDALAGASAEARDLLSYLADAVAFARDDLFVTHARWLNGFMAARGRPAGYAAALRQAVADALAAEGVERSHHGCILLHMLAAQDATATRTAPAPTAT